MNKSYRWLVITIVSIVILGGGLFLYTQKTKQDKEKQTNNEPADDFQRMGQYSFGLDVCNEMPNETIGSAIGKSILLAEGFSLSGSTGCRYYLDESKTEAVSISVEYGEAAKSRSAALSLGEKVDTELDIKLENFTIYSKDNPDNLMDIYLVIDPVQKYVKISRSQALVIDNESLVKLGLETEKKIKSYK